jgi:hypothetical protein
MVLVLMLLCTAALSVGLTSPAESLFTIDVRPVLLQMDPASVAEARARALGLDVDVKLGSLHMHLGWSAIGPRASSTLRPARPL